MDWSKEKIKEVLDILVQSDEFDNLPIPEEWGKLYNIPVKPNNILTLNEYLSRHKQIREFTKITEYEFKGPAPGGVREFKIEEPAPLEIKTVTVTDETEFGISQQLHQNQVPPTESNEKEQQENRALTSTNTPQLPDAE